MKQNERAQVLLEAWGLTALLLCAGLLGCTDGDLVSPDPPSSPPTVGNAADAFGFAVSARSLAFDEACLTLPLGDAGYPVVPIRIVS